MALAPVEHAPLPVKAWGAGLLDLSVFQSAKRTLSYSHWAFAPDLGQRNVRGFSHHREIGDSSS